MSADLIVAGANINVAQNAGQTALMWAAAEGRLDVVKVLIAAGAEVNVQEKDGGWTALMLATWTGHLAIVQVLISAGADVNVQEKDVGWTALMVAAISGYLDIASALIEAGAHINQADEDGMTAFDLAQANSHVAVVEFFQSLQIQNVLLALEAPGDAP